MTPASSSTPDTAWILAAQDGDLGAFDALMTQYQDRVLRFLWRRLGNGPDAEDVGQMVFIKAYRNLHRLDPSRPFGPWIFTLARRECISFLRKKRWLDLTVWVRQSPRPDDSLSRKEGHNGIWDLARNELKPDPFTALWLSVEGECPIREIADTLGKSESAIKVMLHRARNQLTTVLTENGYTPHHDFQPEWDVFHHETRL